MKKFILAIFLALSASTSFGQFKGNILLYGGLNVISDKDAYGTKNTTIHINPGLGYFISNNWATGLFAIQNIHSRTDTGLSPINGTDSKFVAGPFPRYNANLSKIFFFYTELDLGYVSEHGGHRSPHIPSTVSKGFMIGIIPAVGINVYKGFAVNINIGGFSYESTKTI